MCDTATPTKPSFNWNQPPNKKLFAEKSDRTVGGWLLARWEDEEYRDSIVEELIEAFKELTREAIVAYAESQGEGETDQPLPDAAATEAEPPSATPVQEGEIDGDENQGDVSGLLLDLIAEIAVDPYRLKGFFEGRSELVDEMLEYYTTSAS